ncbi:MAG: hypothetical protein GY870_13365, partial [archaeon]|nr:hypothetical protein [archaeon]
MNTIYKRICGLSLVLFLVAILSVGVDMGSNNNARNITEQPYINNDIKSAATTSLSSDYVAESLVINS